jgi:hypothetical protein
VRRSGGVANQRADQRELRPAADASADGRNRRPVSALSGACVQPSEMLVAERTQGLTAEPLDPLGSGLVGRGGPPRLTEVSGGARRRSCRADGITVRGVPPPREEVARPHTVDSGVVGLR